MCSHLYERWHFCKSPAVHRFCCFSVVSGQTKWDLDMLSIIKRMITALIRKIHSVTDYF